MRQPVEFTPWRSIRAGAVGVRDGVRTLADATTSPCLTCRTAPCCSHLPVHSFRVESFADLSYAAYLLNFDRFRLGLSRNGQWSAYYVHPCRFLSRDTLRCTVHDTPEQPQVCVNYNPYNCWYKPAMSDLVGPDFFLVDRTRFEVIAAQVRFDELRSVVEMPGFDTLRAMVEHLSDEPFEGPEPPLPDGAFDEWARLVLEGADEEPEPRARTFDELRDPCNGCSAPCCETVSFAQGRPTTISSVDFYQFALGFPGVELFVGDDGWWITVKSRCRHLVDGRCGIYGRPERPLLCRYYDAWKCTYRPEYAAARPATGVRIRLEQFRFLTEQIRFDGEGNVVAVAPLAELRPHVEQRWRETHEQAGRAAS